MIRNSTHKWTRLAADTLLSRKLPLLIACLCLFALLLILTSAGHKSVTIDEFQALPHGLVIWDTGRMDIDPGAPPLSKLLVALPLLPTIAAPSAENITEGGSSWLLGYKFADMYEDSYQKLFMRARLIPLLFYVLTALLTGLLAKRLYGRTAFVIALFFTLFCPNMMAHGRLVTPDIFLAAAVAGTLLAVDRFSCRWTYANACLLGLSIGLACLFKFTGLLLFFLVPCAAVIMQLRNRKNSISYAKFWLKLGFALVFAVLIINLGYIFQGSFGLLGNYYFESQLLSSISQFLPNWLPIPLPYWFVTGFDVQMAEQGYVAYLLGRLNTTGFWYYYIVAFLVKTPLPILILLILATVSNHRIKSREIPLITVSAGMFLIVSFTGHKNIGIRYLLFLFPLFALWISRLADSDINHKWDQSKRHLLLTGGSVWLFFLHLFIWPNYLPFFNMISGGPSRGHYYLLDSNLDWGQDLILLRRYMQKHKIKSVDLAYAGRVRPEIYNIDYQMLGSGEPQRYAVVSANLLWGRMYFVNGTTYWPKNPDQYAILRDLEPVAVIGHTLYVFDLASYR